MVAVVAMVVGAVVRVKNFFYQTYKPGKLFFYQRGRVSTTKPWHRPSWARVHDYCNYLINETDLIQRHEIYLRGGFLYDIHRTTDVDLNILGEDNLENDLDAMLDIALNKFQLLVDVKWVPELFTPVDNKTVDLPVKVLNCRSVANVYKQVDYEIARQDRRQLAEAKLLSEYLIEYPNNYTHKYEFVKFVKQHGTALQLLNIKTFVDMSEQEFWAKTKQNK